MTQVGHVISLNNPQFKRWIFTLFWNQWALIFSFLRLVISQEATYEKWLTVAFPQISQPSLFESPSISTHVWILESAHLDCRVCIHTAEETIDLEKCNLLQRLLSNWGGKLSCFLWKLQSWSHCCGKRVVRSKCSKELKDWQGNLMSVIMTKRRLYIVVVAREK